MSKKAFEKFINPHLSGAKKKEAIKQQKKKAKKEMRARYEEEKKRNNEKYRLVTKDDKNKRREFPSKNPSDHTRVVPKRSFEKDKFIQSGKPAENQNFIRVTKKEELMPLNKYVAYAGICGRREAADLVKSGEIKVNGTVVTEPGFKVSPDDKITLKNKPIHIQKNLVYILMNKPKDYLTTAKDPQGRKTVLDLVKGATAERIYPVGRLDRNTTGVLLLTNDGELAQKLTHPSFEVKKIYEVKLDKPVIKKDLETILNGLQLEDGFVKADAVSYTDPKDHTTVGIEIHSGRNRIVRRIFEKLGYDVKNLDRVMFGNLTKKNVDRGRYRFLAEKEVRLLKYMNQSFVKSKRD